MNMKLYLVYEKFKGEEILMEIFSKQALADKEAQDHNAKQESYSNTGYIGPKSFFFVREWEVQE